MARYVRLLSSENEILVNFSHEYLIVDLCPSI